MTIDLGYLFNQSKDGMDFSNDVCATAVSKQA